MAKARPSAPALKSGDTVKFVLGGPVMLVVGESPQRRLGIKLVACQWISPDGHFQEGLFLPQHLLPVDRPG